ncbi:aldo/keto reductase family oxidoreductase [Psychrobium sp. 1_MG-2023]|uniref:aldo/keto reductase n=1 Tax=Psychrobium sp. 1_MG-2023 TaxID=3062624 RepID=UPI000C321BB4|nr:aldo/keto reductase [Psychrobium sp. 1_MG-2023]MDP2560820.1 aldo/keto reductase [Psychrobium sp. 1_MG-2023]PKF56695.1 oxidoreductase [Alteromonadales bacterium alter-6D02]
MPTSSMIQGYWRLAQWKLSPTQCLDFVKQHLDLGISTVDHAPVYGQSSCERLFGQALALEPSVRQQLQIITKCGIQGGNTDQGTVAHYFSQLPQIIQSAEDSLTRLGIEQIDIFLLHRPDLLMDADETAHVLESLQKSGKIKHIGVSNFSNSQFSLLQSRLSAPLITNQIEINPINLQATEDGSLDFLQQHNVRPMAWSCLAGGDIFNSQQPSVIRLRETLSQVQQEIGADNIEQVVYAWVLKLPAKPIPILGSGDIARVKSAVAAQQLSLTTEQWYRIWGASKGHGVA